MKVPSFESVVPFASDRISMWLRVVFIVPFFNSNNVWGAHRPNSFDCRGHAAWATDEVDLSREMQQFIFDHQSSCEKRIESVHPGECGIGCNITWGVAYMVRAFFNNEVYRPRGAWTWAHPNSSHCTAELTAIDCFSRPLSLCGVAASTHERGPHSATLSLSLILRQGRFFASPCELAKHVNKTVQWVHGQFIHYFLRPRLDVAEYIQSIETKMQRILHVTGNEMAGTGTIGCHVRGGVLDDGRSPANISFYIANIDKMAAKLAMEGRPVGLVFFCSDLPEETLVSSEHLHAAFPRGNTCCSRTHHLEAVMPRFI